MRDRSGSQPVTNVELFFDLVYVFAVTQLSRHLLGEPTAAGALQDALLMAMIWTVWAYTTWVTNWLDGRGRAGRAGWLRHPGSRPAPHRGLDYRRAAACPSGN